MATQQQRDQMELFDTYLDQNRIYSFEGPSGVRNLERVVQDVCGFGPYSTIPMFLEDNPGALAALISWIREQSVPEWRDSLAALVNEDEDE